MISSGAILDAMSPLVAKWHTGEADTFTLNKQDAFSVDLATHDGFSYGIDPSRISVGFSHRMKIKQSSGAVPIVELMSTPQPFTTLVPEVCRRLMEVAALLEPDSKRNMTQFGIISTTNVSESDAPPGIIRMIRYMGRPWGESGDVPNFDYQIVGTLKSEKQFQDRCIYHLSKPEAAEGLMTAKFDWQRKLNTPKPITGLASFLSETTAIALEFFEKLGEGGQFDVNSSSK